jgi:hypothetical protein
MGKKEAKCIILFKLLSSMQSNLKKLEVFVSVKIQVKVFLDVMPCSIAVGYHHFGGLCFLHLQSARWWQLCLLKM